MKSVGAIAVLATLFSPVSDTVPRFDTNRYCTHLESRLDLPQRPKAACLLDEDDARTQVTGLWSTAKAASRAQCASTQALASFPSYASLLTCLQLAEGIVIRPANPR